MSWFEREIRPMLAVRSAPFSDDGFIYEIKWDGTRCIAFVDVENRRLRLQNRRLLDITHRYPELDFFKVVEQNAILDGEIVVTKDGKPSFPLLQKREHVDSKFKIEILSKTIPAVYIAFDVLYTQKDGWITDLELIERKKVLDEVMENSERIMKTDFINKKGEELYRKVIEIGLEGVVAKKKDSRYQIGKRSKFWRKIKKRNTADCVIVGWLEGEGEREESFGSLILAVYSDGKFKHVGQVGTGFDREFMDWFSKKLHEIEIGKPHFEMEKKGVHWVKPVYVCEVEFLELTEDQKLRSPVFLRLRDDKSPEECKIMQS
ncbi:MULTISPECIES: non-homologous end-joining DNA ligase [unclassified Archaeoglobus]|jgi:bifunctional non-homologous end joining protein LigD|uniref:non-homologous end-joining DNA ligase n=1 Tax=unclassified Archaeoglobus TaxID=2643606 RepID=UPI0025BFED4C|nr:MULTISPECIES: non-homologous end-joining DNA ligase [unclassified Archaeoglobus]